MSLLSVYCIRTFFFSRKQRQEAHKGIFRWGGDKARLSIDFIFEVAYEPVHSVL